MKVNFIIPNLLQFYYYRMSFIMIMREVIKCYLPRLRFNLLIFDMKSKILHNTLNQLKYTGVM